MFLLLLLLLILSLSLLLSIESSLLLFINYYYWCYCCFVFIIIILNAIIIIVKYLWIYLRAGNKSRMWSLELKNICALILAPASQWDPIPFYYFPTFIYSYFYTEGYFHLYFVNYIIGIRFCAHPSFSHTNIIFSHVSNIRQPIILGISCLKMREN